MNLPVLQKMIEYRRCMCQEYLNAETITQLLLDVGTKAPSHNDNYNDDDPYQQFMNVYRQNLFQAADESVRASRRRRAFLTLQRLNREMDSRVSRISASNGTALTSIPVPTNTTTTTTPCYNSPRDESSLVSLEMADAAQPTCIPPPPSSKKCNNKNDIPHSVLMMPWNKPARRISLPEVVDCGEEGIL